jgi:hypothetical protein
MAYKMRLIQKYQVGKEDLFWDLEKKFAALEKRRKDFPKGRRFKPVSAMIPCNSLICEWEFDTLDEAKNCLSFFLGDKEHDVLYKKQSPLMEDVNVEFYETKDF